MYIHVSKTYDIYLTPIMALTGYTKLFSSILASTIWREDDKTRLVWITLLALTDKYGVAECSIPGLADMAHVTLQDCEVALSKLKAPDPYSRTKDFDGRRIEECDGGFILLNHAKYKNRMSEDERREYNRIKQQEFREKRKPMSNSCQQKSKMSMTVNDGQQKSAMSAHTDTDTDTDSDTKADTDIALSAHEEGMQGESAASPPRVSASGVEKSIPCEQDQKQMVEPPIETPQSSATLPPPSDFKLDGGLPQQPIIVKSKKVPVVKAKYHPDSEFVLNELNRISGARFLPVDKNLSMISARLHEKGVDTQGIIQMIDRQKLQWEGQSFSDGRPMSDLLRPSTLFGPQNFANYYGTKDLPITKGKINGNNRPAYSANDGTLNADIEKNGRDETNQRRQQAKVDRARAELAAKGIDFGFTYPIPALQPNGGGDEKLSS